MVGKNQNIKALTLFAKQPKKKLKIIMHIFS